MILGSAQFLLIALYCDWLAMSSYVFQFFCGPEGIALANPGRARTRPALAGPPPRATAELIFEDPAQPPAARLRSASASTEQERPRRARRSVSSHRRRRRRDRRDRDRRHHRHHHRQPRSRTPRGDQQRPLQTGLRDNGKHRRKRHSYQPQRLSRPSHRQRNRFSTDRQRLPIKIGECHAPIRKRRRLYSQKGHNHRRGPILVYSSKARGHERPRTPPKKAPAKPPRPPRHHEPKAAPLREPEPPAQVQATELVAKGQQPVETMFKDVMIASQSDLESQIHPLLPGSDPDVHVKDGLTLFTQYVYFRLQYWYNK